jgi:hypothetical protein
MRLGANFIMHRDVPSWRLLRVIDSLEGTRFDRAVDVDFSELVNGAFPSEQAGLMSVDSLISEIESILLKTKPNNLPKALLAGLVKPTRNAADILSKVHMDRKGDLFAFEGQTIYIFLSACPPSHVIETIERKLKNSLGAIFSTHSLWTERTEIQQQLLSLKDRMIIQSNVYATALTESIGLPEQSDDTLQSIFPEERAHANIAPLTFKESGHATYQIDPGVVAVDVSDALAAPSEPEFEPERAVKPEPQVASPAQAVDAPRNVKNLLEPVSTRFKPLVFLNSRSSSDAPTE